MKTTVDFYQFRHAFMSARPENFSYDGLCALFDYLEEFENDTGEELELDVVAICCDFAEDSPKQIAEYYDIDISQCEDDDDIMETVSEYIQNQGGFVGETADSIVYRQF